MNCSNARKPDKINLWRLWSWSNDHKFFCHHEVSYHASTPPTSKLLASAFLHTLTTSPPPILHGVEASSASHSRVCFHSIELRLGDHPDHTLHPLTCQGVAHIAFAINHIILARDSTRTSVVTSVWTKLHRPKEASDDSKNSGVRCN